MRRASRIRRAGSWPEAAAVGTVTLSYDARHRRRIRLHDDAGTAFLLDLERCTQMIDGDGLELSDGGWLRVQAAVEPVAEVAAKDAAHLARLAWHLGNRHIPVQVLHGGSLRIRRDHVLEQMLAGLGASIARAEAPFCPESGAYAHCESGRQHQNEPHKHNHNAEDANHV